MSDSSNAAAIDTLVTSDPAKLPAEWSAAVDVTKPVPVGVTFFERKIVAGDFLKAIAIAIFCIVLGLICVPLGIAFLWSDRSNQHTSNSVDWWVLFFGLTLLFAAWLMIASMLANWRTMRKQDHGEPTRLGIFIAPDALFEANEHGYCLIPRERFVSIAGGEVKYLKQDAQKKDQTKSFKLPTSLVRDQPSVMCEAIDAWARH